MVGGWSDKTKLILISTLVEVVVEVKVELGNNNCFLLNNLLFFIYISHITKTLDPYHHNKQVRSAFKQNLQKEMKTGVDKVKKPHIQI